MKVKGLVITGVVVAVIGAGLAIYGRTRSDFDITAYAEKNLKIVDETVDASKVNQIDLHISADQVKITGTDRSDILIKNKEIDDLKYTIKLSETGELSIVQPSFDWFLSFFKTTLIKQHAYFTSPLEIEVPKTSNYNYAFKISAGTVEVKDIEANNVDFKLSAGTVKMDNFKANDFNANISAGTLTFKSTTISDMNLDVSAGTVSYTGTFTKACDIDISAGSVSLSLTDSESNYTINGKGSGAVKITVDKSAGSFQYDFK